MTSKYLFSFVAFFLSFVIFSQENYTTFEPNSKFPFGQYNPKAPKQLKDFEMMIGECECKSYRKDTNQKWKEPVKMIWKWKYIMNGMGVQDETLKADGLHSGSIRVYDKDSLHWNVHYYSSSSFISPLSTWHGNKKDGKIILYKDQKAPNGMDGYSRLTFFDISKKGYKWIGEWVDKSEKVTFPFWKIVCTRKEK